MKVITSHGPLCQHYMDRIQETIDKALLCHHRTLAVRVDLRLPDVDIDTDMDAATDPACISRFIESLKAQIKTDLRRKIKTNMQVHSCVLRYVWVKEFSQEGKKHYHVLLLLNKHAYGFLGDYTKESGNLACMISRAWARALRVAYPENQSLTYFPDKPVCYLAYQKEFSFNAYTELLYRSSYLAKFKSKSIGPDERSFGCSQY